MARISDENNTDHARWRYVGRHTVRSEARRLTHGLQLAARPTPIPPPRWTRWPQSSTKSSRLRGWCEDIARPRPSDTLGFGMEAVSGDGNARLAQNDEVGHRAAGVCADPGLDRCGPGCAVWNPSRYSLYASGRGPNARSDGAVLGHRQIHRDRYRHRRRALACRPRGVPSTRSH